MPSCAATGIATTSGLRCSLPNRTCEIELVCFRPRCHVRGMAIRDHPAGPATPAGSDWESSCWYTDEDVDYLELEIELTGGVKLQRQFVLAREDRFLFLADAVMSPQPGNLEYRSVLPLAAASRIPRRRGEPRRVLVAGPAAADGTASARQEIPIGAAALPGRWPRCCRLALPEWRAEQTEGELRRLRRVWNFDKRPPGGAFRSVVHRSRPQPIPSPHDLAATHCGRIARACAVGCRRRFSRCPWRSAVDHLPVLGGKGNRTLLGHNLATESLIARFGKDGEVTSIVEIE